MNVFNESDSDCFTCRGWEELSPPPDLIFTMPPPPLPPSLQHILLENQSIQSDSNNAGKLCNFCHVFYNPNGEGSNFRVPNPGLKTDESWFSLMALSILASTCFGILLIFILIKCKKWKIFPVSDSCPILPESFFGGHKSAPPPCSPSDSCISPVVSEKPQSVLTDCPNKKTSIPSKYWRRTNDLSQGGERIIHTNGNLVEGSTVIDDYTGDGASCTSSPVYAELDAVDVNHSQIQQPMVITGPSQSISPYAVHTYSEVGDVVRMAALGSSSALLPDASYDNAAYLVSTNSDQYHGRSLRRHRTATLAQLGSTTPLLGTHHHINGSPPVSYLTGQRPQKKPRPPYAHQVARANMMRECLDAAAAASVADQRHLPSRRYLNPYDDLQMHSPSLSTFRMGNAPYVNREPKRSLPPVPGVRL